MIVVSDTSPLNYLLLIGAESLLPQLFGSVVIPPAVLAELSRAATPQIVCDWIANRPEWLVEVALSSEVLEIGLDAGESEAISLSLELGADALLVDDRKGRLAAEERGIRVIGTTTLLELAAQQGLLSLEDAFARLTATNFRIAPHLLREALQRDEEFRRRSG